MIRAAIRRVAPRRSNRSHSPVVGPITGPHRGTPRLLRSQFRRCPPEKLTTLFRVYRLGIHPGALVVAREAQNYASDNDPAAIEFKALGVREGSAVAEFRDRESAPLRNGKFLDSRTTGPSVTRKDGGASRQSATRTRGHPCPG